MRFYCEDTLTTEDGARLWYAQLGEGDPPLVLCDGVGCDGAFWKYLAPELSARHRVLRFHYRGHGRSGVPTDPSRVGVAWAADDLDAIMAEAGIAKAVIVGHSMGAQVLFEFHRRHPERVLGLVPICGGYGNALDAVHDDTKIKLAFPLVHCLADLLPAVARAFTRTLLPTEASLQYALTFEANRQLVHREDMQAYFEHLARMDPLVFLDTLQSAAEHTAWDHLGRVDVPTLIVAGDHDRFTPLWLSQRMHRAIPESELLVVRSGTHSAPIELPELIALRIRRFLKERLPSF
ncbi:MAG TPA: alpha/beta hydrolase [Myxococcales bacterium]